MNVINPRILYKDLDPETLIIDLISPPELNIVIELVTLICVADTWHDLDNLLKLLLATKGIVGMVTNPITPEVFRRSREWTNKEITASIGVHLMLIWFL